VTSLGQDFEASATQIKTWGNDNKIHVFTKQ
jgi:hypothetical protein